MCGPSTLHLLSSSLSVCHFIPPLPLLSIPLPPSPLPLHLSSFFPPNLSIRSVDKLFMLLSVPEALSPLLHPPAPLLPLFCRRSPGFLPRPPLLHLIFIASPPVTYKRTTRSCLLIIFRLESNFTVTCNTFIFFKQIFLKYYSRLRA